MNGIGFWADSGDAEVFFECEDGSEAAQLYVDGCDWGEVEKSFAVRVYTWTVDKNGDRIDEDVHLILVHPEEPECEASELHRWVSPYCIVGGIRENPGVWGIGGAGLSLYRVCAFCGLARMERTTTHGYETEYNHDSIEYPRDSYASLDDLAKHWLQHADIPDGLDPESELAELLEVQE